VQDGEQEVEHPVGQDDAGICIDCMVDGASIPTSAQQRLLHEGKQALLHAPVHFPR